MSKKLPVVLKKGFQVEVTFEPQDRYGNPVKAEFDREPKWFNSNPDVLTLSSTKGLRVWLESKAVGVAKILVSYKLRGLGYKRVKHTVLINE